MHPAFRFGQPAIVIRRQSPAPPAEALYRRVGVVGGSSAITGFLRLRTRAAGATGREVPEGDIEFAATLATEAPVVRSEGWEGDYDELLPMSGCDLSRAEAAGGLPMLWDHVQEVPLGTWDNIRVEDGRLVADGRLTRTVGVVRSPDGPEQPVEAIREGVANRTIRGVSIGYRITESKRVAAGESFMGFTADPRRAMLVATRWTVFEASLVSIPADTAAGIRKAPAELSTRSLRTRQRDDRTRARDALAGAWLGGVAFAGR